MDNIVFKTISVLVLLAIGCSSNTHFNKDQSRATSGSRQHPPSPYDKSYQMIVLTGGKVYGIPNTTATTTLEHVCEPQKMDVIIAAGKILALMQPSETASFINYTKAHNLHILPISVQDQVVMPGLIDPHIHAIGGGGEQGPYSRTAESHLSELINGGLTTVIGILGTDGVTRSLSSLLQKMKSLEYDGLSTWMWVGSYRIPIVTLTGSFQQDLLLIDKVLGAGELALSDHRSSWPSKSEVLQLLTDARVAGMLSGKPGVIHFHVGTSPVKLDLLWQILNETTIPIYHMYPTHMTSRGDDLIQEAAKWLKAGGVCDFTANMNYRDKTTTVDTLIKFRNEKLPLKQITVSSDAYGSIPTYDEAGRLVAYGMSSPDLALNTIQNLVLKHAWPLEEAIQFSTANPARYLNFHRKGFIAKDYDADVIVLNQTDLNLLYVFAKGRILKTPIWTKRDMFEPIIN